MSLRKVLAKNNFQSRSEPHLPNPLIEKVKKMKNYLHAMKQILCDTGYLTFARWLFQKSWKFKPPIWPRFKLVRPRPPKIVEKICLFENIFPSDGIHTHPPWWKFLVSFFNHSLGKTRPGKSCKSSSSGKFWILHCPQNSVIRDKGQRETCILNIGVA